MVVTPCGLRYPVAVNLLDTYEQAMDTIEATMLALQPPDWLRIEELCQPLAKAYDVYFGGKPVCKKGPLHKAGVGAGAIVVLSPVQP